MLTLAPLTRLNATGTGGASFSCEYKLHNVPFLVRVNGATGLRRGVVHDPTYSVWPRWPNGVGRRLPRERSRVRIPLGVRFVRVRPIYIQWRPTA